LREKELATEPSLETDTVELIKPEMKHVITCLGKAIVLRQPIGGGLLLPDL
jgi:hypothetical protein